MVEAFTGLVGNGAAVNLGDVILRFKPPTLINKAQAMQYYKDTHNCSWADAIALMTNDEDAPRAIYASIEYIWLWLDEKEHNYTLDEFSTLIGNTTLNLSQLHVIVGKITEAGEPEYTFDDFNGKKKPRKTVSVLTWTIIVFALIGIMSTLDFANSITAEDLKNLSSSLLDKFNILH